MSDRLVPEDRGEILRPGARLPWWAYAESTPDDPDSQQTSATPDVFLEARDNFFAQGRRAKLPEHITEALRDDVAYRSAARSAARQERQDMRAVRNAVPNARARQRQRNRTSLYPESTELGRIIRAAELVQRLVRFLPRKSERIQQMLQQAGAVLEATKDSRQPWDGGNWVTGGVVPYGAKPVRAAQAPVSIRVNNPGAIRPGGGWPTETGSAAGFSVFESPEAGFEALFENLDSYYTRHGVNTIADVIARWAPASDGNDERDYVAHLRQRLGEFGAETDDFNSHDLHQMVVLSIAIAEKESGKSFAWTKETVIEGLRMANVLRGGQRRGPLFSKKAIDKLARSMRIADGNVTINGVTVRSGFGPSSGLTTEAG